MPENILSQVIADLEPSATEEVDNAVAHMRQRGVTDIVSLGVGEPCFDTPDNIKQSAADALFGGETKYQPTAGAYALREAICEKLVSENGIQAGVDDVMVTAGGKFAIYLAFQALLQPGDQVVLLDPAWVSYEPAAQMAGAEVVRVPTNAEEGFQPNLEAVGKALKPAVKILVVNSPCNPTGTLYSNAAIREIAEMTAANGTLLLSDEVYEYQVYDGEFYSPGANYDHVITVNAFSKSHAMTGWRLGYVTAPQEVLEGMTKIYQHSTSCVTAFAQYGAIEALKSEASRQAALEMAQGYRERRDLMLRLIEEVDFFDLSAIPQGAFYCFPKYKLDKPSVELAKALLEEVHVATVPGAAFGACGEGYLRLSYATTEEAIEEAFKRIETFFKKR